MPMSEANKKVRIQILHDDEVRATKKGIEICNSVITWGWLDKARAELGVSFPKPKVKPEEKATPIKAKVAKTRGKKAFA